jgi:hypothetical protein
LAFIVRWQGAGCVRILIDHSGAVHRHGLLEDEITWTLDADGLAVNETHKGRAKGALDPFVDCSKCGCIRERGLACPSCGFKPGPRPDLIIADDADLVEIGKRAVPLSYERRQDWFRELMALRIERNQLRPLQGKAPLKAGWVAGQYRDKFGDWPPCDWNHLHPAADVSAEVRSWVRSRDIAYAKRMQKANAA